MDYILAILIYASMHEFGIPVDPIEVVYWVTIDKDSKEH